MTRTRAVLLTATRSGSTWLLSVLNSQPGIAFYEELFLDRPRRAKYEWLSENQPERFAHFSQVDTGPKRSRLSRYLDYVENYDPAAQAVGFKLMNNHLRRNPGLLARFLARKYRLVVLLRENVFESVASRIVAVANDSAHGTGEVEHRPVTIDPKELIASMKKRRAVGVLYKSLAACWPHPAVVTSYEEQVRDQQQAMGRILKCLGMTTQAPLSSELKKRIQKPYSEIIANYGEVRGALTSAGLGRYLTE